MAFSVAFNLLAVKPLIITLYIVVGVLAACLITFIIFIFRGEKKEKKVQVVSAKSNLCNALRALNAKYKFYTDIKPRYEFYDSVATMGQLQKVSLYETLLAKLEEENQFFDTLMRRVYTNRVNFDAYCKEYEKLPSITPQTDPKSVGLSQTAYYEIENRLFQEGKLKPVMGYTVYLRTTCPSANAITEYEFSFEQLVQAVRVHNNNIARESNGRA